MEENALKDLYLVKKLSVYQIALKYKCSENKVNYWIKKYGIKKRSISEATYLSQNGKSDPFVLNKLVKNSEWFLKGLGIGLYWGEGNKLNRYSIKLGNTDPALIHYFIKFLTEIYGINNSRLKFGLQIFNDIDPNIALRFWINILKVKPSQFQKPVVSVVRGNGTYKNKSKYGVLTVYFNNIKLRNIIMGEIEKLRNV